MPQQPDINAMIDQAAAQAKAPAASVDDMIDATAKQGTPAQSDDIEKQIDAVSPKAAAPAAPTPNKGGIIPNLEAGFTEFGRMLGNLSPLPHFRDPGAGAPNPLRLRTPEDTTATTLPEYMARGAGSMPVAPVAGAVAGAGQLAGESAAPKGWGGVGGVLGSLVGAGLGGAAFDAALAKMPAMSTGARAVDAVKSHADMPSDQLQAAVTAPTQPAFPGDKPTLAQKIPDPGIALGEEAYRKTIPEPFITSNVAQNVARRDALQTVEPPRTASPQDVADLFRSQLDAVHQAGVAAVRGAASTIDPEAVRSDMPMDEAAQAAQDAILQRSASLGGNDTSALDEATAQQLRGVRARTAVQEAASAAKAREGQLWDTVRKSGLVQFDGTAIGEAARFLIGEVTPREGQPQTTAALSSQDGPVVNTLASWKGPVDLDTFMLQRSDISSRINQAQQAGDRQAVRRLEILKGAIDNALESGIVTKAAEQDKAVAAGQLDPSDTMAANLARDVEQWRAARASGQLSQTGLADSAGNDRGAPGTRQNAVPGDNGAAAQEQPSGHGSGKTEGDTGLAPGNEPLDPAAIYAAARQATREYHTLYGDKTPTGAVLKRGPFQGGHATPDSGVLPLYFKPGAAGAEAIQNLVSVVGQEKAESLVRDQAAASLRYAAEKNGKLDVPRWQKWMRDYDAALSPFPDMRAQFAKPAEAQAALDRAIADHSGATKAFEKSAAGDWLKADPDKAAKALFEGTKRASRADQIVKAIGGDKAATEGLRRAVWTEFMRRAVPGLESAEPSETRFRPQIFQDVLRDNRAVLQKVLKPEQLATLEGIGASLARDQRVLSMVRERVGSNTARDSRLIARLEGRTSILGMALDGALDMGATALGAAMEGLPGGVVGHFAVKSLAKIGTALRQAGIQSRNNLIARMYADPEFARTMFEKYAPGTIRMTADRISRALLPTATYNKRQSGAP